MSGLVPLYEYLDFQSAAVHHQLRDEGEDVIKVVTLPPVVVPDLGEVLDLNWELVILDLDLDQKPFQSNIVPV